MKLKKFNAGQVSLKSSLIQYISDRSDRYGDKLLEFMDLYHLHNLQSATVAQLREYINTHLSNNEQSLDQ